MCLRRFRSLQNIKVYTPSKASVLNTRTALPALRPPPTCSCYVTRTFCSDGRQNDDPNVKIKHANLIISQGPLGWLSKAVNLWFVKKFIDREFEEREFLRGAKQALCVVSDLLHRQNWEEMEGVLSDKLTNAVKNDMDIGKLGPVVTMQQISSAHIQKVQVGFVENGGGKVVDIQVAFYLSSAENEDNLFERKIGNVKIIGIPVPKIRYYTFRKMIFPDSVGTWQVEAISQL